MTSEVEISERAVAELVAQLARIAYGEGFREGLTPAQWTALHFFSRANRFSRTVSAFAEFHGTTRGTASQTVKSLVAQGHLLRLRSEADGRSARLELTDKSRELLRHDPFNALMQAAGSLSPSARRTTARSLQHMLGVVACSRGRTEFGICMSCRHLGGCCLAGKPAYHCGLVKEPLAEAEIEELCVNFEPGPNALGTP